MMKSCVTIKSQRSQLAPGAPRPGGRTTRAPRWPAATSDREAPPEAAAGGACPLFGPLPPRTRRSWWAELDLSAPHLKTQSEILAGGPAARGRYMLFETALIGDADQARALLGCEGDAWTVSVPPHLAKILGSESMGVLRRLLSPALSAEAVSSYLPEIQDLAEKYCAAWAARGCVPALHEELKLFTFEARA
ncbi:hypothetical protein MNEG_3171 [Monoraphidium neglectum]|uniref:Uncharacterized protein n=1 Tax=Monoraphidium neglectum TaxID=145388 RepID=A0A0D2NIP2_9CHLO|nr:hypothetical protein MNEG_3171 [Monoraphidium neglectum]KIZ04791.1 hypothetical protein MNEG_3171 [Monoraphidium neglectum]|eukprot:XP_013903810.1 hypothetical protein MNEG_3171 [Monoraphidium neglectum]